MPKRVKGYYISPRERNKGLLLVIAVVFFMIGGALLGLAELFQFLWETQKETIITAIVIIALLMAGVGIFWLKKRLDKAV